MTNNKIAKCLYSFNILYFLESCSPSLVTETPWKLRTKDDMLIQTINQSIFPSKADTLLHW